MLYIIILCNIYSIKSKVSQHNTNKKTKTSLILSKYQLNQLNQSLILFKYFNILIL